MQEMNQQAVDTLPPIEHLAGGWGLLVLDMGGGAEQNHRCPQVPCRWPTAA